VEQLRQVQSARVEQLATNLKALLRRYVEGDVEGFEVSLVLVVVVLVVVAGAAATCVVGCRPSTSCTVALVMITSNDHPPPYSIHPTPSTQPHPTDKPAALSAPRGGTSRGCVIR